MLHSNESLHDAAYRVWIGQFDDWNPRRWDEVPAEIIITELAEDRCFTAAEALAYIEGFNTQMLLKRRRQWAVMVAVVLRYEGDAQPGERLNCSRIATAAWAGSLDAA